MKTTSLWGVLVCLCCICWASCGQDDEPAPLVEVSFSEEVSFILPPLGASNGELRGAISAVIPDDAWRQAAQNTGVNPENLENARINSVSVEVLSGNSSVDAFGEIELLVLSEDEASASSMWTFRLSEVSGTSSPVGTTLPPLVGNPHKYQVSFPVENAYFDLVEFRMVLSYTGFAN